MDIIEEMLPSDLSLLFNELIKAKMDVIVLLFGSRRAR